MNELTVTDLFLYATELFGGPVGQGFFAVFILIIVVGIPNLVKQHLDKLEKEPYETYWSEQHQNKLVLWRGLYGFSIILFRFIPGVIGWGLLTGKVP